MFLFSISLSMKDLIEFSSMPLIFLYFNSTNLSPLLSITLQWSFLKWLMMTRSPPAAFWPTVNATSISYWLNYLTNIITMTVVKNIMPMRLFSVLFYSRFFLTSIFNLGDLKSLLIINYEQYGRNSLTKKTILMIIKIRMIRFKKFVKAI